VYYDVAMCRLAQQLSQVDALDGKFSNVVTFSSVILGVFATLLTVRADDLHWYSFFLLAGGSMAYLIAVYFSIRAYAVKNWSLRPDVAALKSNCAENDLNTMRQWVANECAMSMETNDRMIKAKVKAGSIALAAVPMETLLLAAAAISSLV